MAHTFVNISFEDESTSVLTESVDGIRFTPEGWSVVTNTNSAEEYADFGASAGNYIERAERFEAHWTGLSAFVDEYEDPFNPAELGIASFNTGINATTYEGFEREWSTNEEYLFGLALTEIASFDPVVYSPLTTSLELNNGTTNESISFANYPNFDWSNPFSVGIWVKMTAGTAQYLMSKRNGPLNYQGWFLSVSAGNDIKFSLDGGSNLMTATFGYDLADDTWHHVLIRYDGSGLPANVRCSVDGVDQGSPTTSGSVTSGSILTTNPLTVGEMFPGWGNDVFTGRACHSSMWDKQLSAAEGAEVFGGGAPQDLLSLSTAANLVHWSALGDGDSLGAGNINDLSAPGNDGTFNNGDLGDFISDVPSPSSGGAEPFEDYEEQWNSNESYAFNIAGISTTAAQFDTGTPEPVEDYEEEWQSNESYLFLMPFASLSAALFDGESYEDYEETDLTQWYIRVVNALGTSYYTCIVDGEELTYLSGGAPTVTTIRDGLISVIGSGSKPVVTSVVDASTFTLARDPNFLEPKRNTELALAVEGPSTGDLTKTPTSETSFWTQTGQMATDP